MKISHWNLDEKLSLEFLDGLRIQAQALWDADVALGDEVTLWVWHYPRVSSIAPVLRARRQEIMEGRLSVLAVSSVEWVASSAVEEEFEGRFFSLRWSLPNTPLRQAPWKLERLTAFLQDVATRAVGPPDWKLLRAPVVQEAGYPEGLLAVLLLSLSLRGSDSETAKSICDQAQVLWPQLRDLALREAATRGAELSLPEQIVDLGASAPDIQLKLTVLTGQG